MMVRPIPTPAELQAAPRSPYEASKTLAGARARNVDYAAIGDAWHARGRVQGGAYVRALALEFECSASAVRRALRERRARDA